MVPPQIPDVWNSLWLEGGEQNSKRSFDRKSIRLQADAYMDD